MNALTKREQQSYMLCGALGFTPEEAAEELNIAANTVRVNIRRVKEKTNWNKISELSASAICDYLGVDYSQIRTEILEAVKAGLIVLLFSFFLAPIDEARYSRRITARRNVRVEKRYRTEETA